VTRFGLKVLSFVFRVSDFMAVRETPETRNTQLVAELQEEEQVAKV